MSMDYRYEQNEAAYQRLAATGRPADYAGRSFEHFDLRRFLEAVLPLMKFASDRPRAFEYGTGTGSGACFLAERGFAVDAVDISPTAIELACRFAAQRGLSISFSACDIRRMPSTGPLYDLVVDNFCLQHVIAESERRHVLMTVRSMVMPEGFFVIATVPYRAGRDFGSDRFDPSTGIRYRRITRDSPETCAEAVRIGAEWYVPWRRLVLTPQSLRGELESAGFRVVHQAQARCLCVPDDRSSIGLPAANSKKSQRT
jgi:SAM-dependent methyltransferase